jgi:hypothetical protein
MRVNKLKAKSLFLYKIKLKGGRSIKSKIHTFGKDKRFDGISSPPTGAAALTISGTLLALVGPGFTDKPSTLGDFI